jgi:hypothetical protein
MGTQLVVEEMRAWQASILNFIAWLIGLRGGSVAYLEFRTVITLEDDIEPTINDIVKNNEEDAMNRVSTDKLTEMESGE